MRNSFRNPTGLLLRSLPPIFTPTFPLLSKTLTALFCPLSPTHRSSCSPLRSIPAFGKRRLTFNNVPDASNSLPPTPTVPYTVPNAAAPITTSPPTTRTAKVARTRAVLGIKSNLMTGFVLTIVASIVEVLTVLTTRLVKHVTSQFGKLVSESLAWLDKLLSTPVTFVVPALLTSNFNFSLHSIFSL